MSSKQSKTAASGLCYTDVDSDGSWLDEFDSRSLQSPRAVHYQVEVDSESDDDDDDDDDTLPASRSNAADYRNRISSVKSVFRSSRARPRDLSSL